MKAAFLILSILFLAGCATNAGIHFPAGQEPVNEISISVEYFDKDHHQLSPEYQPKHVFLVFPHIPGQIFGTPTGQPVFLAPVTVGTHTQVDLEQAGKILAQQSSTIKTGDMTKGLSITPVNTRFSRVGTFPHDARTSEVIGGGGFIDPQSKSALILVYFDRPCTVSGDVFVDGGMASHAITIPSAGFHWIEARRTSEGQHELSRHKAINHVVFSVYLHQLKSL